MAAAAGGGSIKSSSTQWTGTFSEETSGPGLYVEGAVKSWRYHSVHSSKDIHRYLAVQVQVLLARERTWDGRGLETEPTMRGLKALRQGYQKGQWPRRGADDPVPVSLEDVSKRVGGEAGAALPKGFCPEQKGSLHPVAPGVFEFWGDITKSKSVELREGAILRLRTRGDSVFMEGMARA
ncbi:MAG: hypothetical protein Q8P67_00155, partial [archaeon]|nr:hypothetical protein [archaeon]